MGEKKKYEPPVMTQVKFEDKELVAFSVCKKATQIEQDTASCCVVLPNSEQNLNSLDPS